MDVFYFNKKSVAAAGVTAACCVLMVVFPGVALDSARKGITLWFSDVLPALLPFFICANFLQNIGVTRLLKPGIFPFVMSVLSGYPMGAKIIGDLRRGGEISTREAKRLLSFCNTSGPAFIVGAVGAGMLGSGFLGLIVAVSHYAGALINGAVYTKILGEKEARDKPNARSDPGGLGVQEGFTEAILISFRSLGIVLAYIVLFMFLTDILHMCGILSILPNPECRALVKGFFEMTVGCGAVAECAGAGAAVKCVLCSAIMSWGGLSVLGQSVSMVAGTDIPAGYIFLTKATHGLFSAAIAFIVTAVVL